MHDNYYQIWLNEEVTAHDALKSIGIALLDHQESLGVQLHGELVRNKDLVEALIDEGCKVLNIDDGSCLISFHRQYCEPEFHS